VSREVYWAGCVVWFALGLRVVSALEACSLYTSTFSLLSVLCHVLCAADTSTVSRVP